MCALRPAGSTAPDPAPDPAAGFTIDVPTLADVPGLARVHVGGWEVAYGHALHGEEWFGEPAIARRLEPWTRWLTPGSAQPSSRNAKRVRRT